MSAILAGYFPELPPVPASTPGYIMPPRPGVDAPPRPPRPVDETPIAIGDTFRGLRVAAIAENTNGGLRCTCECIICGKQRDVQGYALRRHEVTGCGNVKCRRAVNSRDVPESYVGHTFGALEVLEAVRKYATGPFGRYLCKCEFCGTRKNVKGSDLRKGDARTCGSVYCRRKLREREREKNGNPGV